MATPPQPDHDDRSEDESDRASVVGEERQVDIVMERIILQYVTRGEVVPTVLAKNGWVRCRTEWGTFRAKYTTLSLVSA